MNAFEELFYGYRLTTVEIIYHLPDFPEVLQSFIWQAYDLPPEFPRLHHFLDFWQQSIEGPLHSVHIAHAGPLISPKFHTPVFSGVLH